MIGNTRFSLPGSNCCSSASRCAPRRDLSQGRGEAGAHRLRHGRLVYPRGAQRRRVL